MVGAFPHHFLGRGKSGFTNVPLLELPHDILLTNVWTRKTMKNSIVEEMGVILPP